MRLPRIRRQQGTYWSQGHRESVTQIGWPSLHVEVVSNFYTWNGETTRGGTSVDLHALLPRGFYLNLGGGDGCYPDTDEEGWPE
jgi:hypothetical protein